MYITEDNKNGQSIPPLYSRKAFTLSEVLITLVIIGIISAITVPTLFANHKWQEYKSALKKAHSTLNNAVNAYYLENGTFPKCGLWDANPYGGRVCAERNESGICTRYTLADGSPMPSDYNGFGTDCTSLWKSFQKTMQVQRVCDTHAYANGCIPDYKGFEEIYVENNPDASEYDVTIATNSQDFLKSRIRNGSAIVLNDGTIIFTGNAYNIRYMAVDVNGMKGPNKWGHDVHKFRLQMKDRTSVPRYLPNDNLLDKGGKTATTLLYGKD